MPSANELLILSAILFGIGAFGALVRKNAIVVFMCIEIMLNAVNLAFVSFSNALQNLDGIMLAFFVVVIAAAEAVVGLAIILALFRKRKTVDVDQFTLLHS